VRATAAEQETAEARAMAASSTVDVDRIVFSYAEDGWPQGLLIGYEYDAGFFLEHVVVIGRNPFALMRTVSAGIAQADRDYRYIAVPIHKDHPLASQLEKLALRYRFTKYHTDGAYTYFVRYNRS
jgi:hypothetical protein